MKKISVFLFVTLVMLQLIAVTAFATDDENTFVAQAAPEENGTFLPSNKGLLMACFADYDSLNNKYSPDSLVSAEEILRYVFTVSGVRYSGEVETDISEKEVSENSLKVKSTLEKASIPDIPDSYVSIERRYIWKDEKYQLSAVDIDIEIGEEGIYFRNDINDPVELIALWVAASATENPLSGHMEYFIYDDSSEPDESNPEIIKGDYYTKKLSFFDTTLEYVVDIDSDTYSTNPEKWNGAVQYYTSIEYGTVGAEHSITGEAIKEGDYKNYQLVHMHRGIKLIYPEVEEYKAPQTSLTTAVYAAVAALALGVVVVKKKRG